MTKKKNDDVEATFADAGKELDKAVDVVEEANEAGTPVPPPTLEESGSVEASTSLPNQDPEVPAEKNYVLPGDSVAEVHRKANNQAEVDRFMAEKPSTTTKMGDALRSLTPEAVKKQIFDGVHGAYVEGQFGSGPRVIRKK